MEWLVIRQIMANRDDGKKVGLLVVVKTVLYEGTIALGASMEFRKDLRRYEPRGDSGGPGWRKEAAKT